MKKLVLGCLVAFSLVGCGAANTCEQLSSAQDKFFAGKTECQATSNGATITAKKPASTCNTASCSAADEKALVDYASCLEKAPACTTGNESAAVNAAFACALSAASAVSEACQANLK